MTDLTIPVAGIPITIMRSYDSLNAGKSGDFGYGWSLSYGDAQLEVDLAPGADIGWGGYPAFLNGTRVYVTMPNGEREGFTFQPYEKSYDSFGLLNYWHPYFVPDPGVLDTLSAPDALLSKDPATGEYYSVTDSGIDTYNPEDPNYGGAYTVTNLQGMASTIDATTGKLLSMKARNGNTLTFSDTEIKSNTGRAVAFTRDPAGHITAITDPNHNSVTYSYDVNGDLVSVTDRMGNPPTKYEYNNPNHAHYLTGVVDPLGVQQLTVSFGSDGRMSQMKDAAQDPLNFAYDTTALTETVTDPNLPSGSQSATVDFDTRGNVLQTTDPTGAQSSATYNNPSSDPAAKDLPDTVTQVKRNPDNTTTSYTTQLTFDNKGEVTGTTDPTGAVTHTTYGPFGEVVTTSDALGNTTTNSYDTNGNLLSTVSAAAVATYFSYDTHNNLTAVSQGSPINPGYSPPGTPPPPPAAVTTYSYDTYGNLSSSTSPTSVTTNYTYDANGNPTGTSFTWTDPNNSTNTKVISTSTEYNANDQETVSYDEYGEKTLTNYDAKGRVTSTTHVLNNVNITTTTVYDNRDEVIQTTNPDGTITDSVYDAEGRVIYTDDPHVSGQTDVHGTHTIYDSDGRVVETDRLDSVKISVTPGVSSQFVSAGGVLSTTTSQYNDLGQLISTTDAAGLTTQYTYDKDGRQTSETAQLPNGGPQITTSTEYDAAGRAEFTTDGRGNVTQSVYDGDGKLLKTIFADGTYIQYGYDANGRKISGTDQLGNTTQYQYDTQGRLTAVKLPAVVNPSTGLSVNPTTVYSYDNYGNLTSIIDANNHTTSFTYDPYGHETSRTLPEGQGDTSPPTETMTYDNYGRPSVHTDFGGNQAVYQYDTLGRLDETDYYLAGHTPSTCPPDEKVTTQYDSLGQVSQVTDSAYGTITYAYDLDNRLIQEITPEGEIDYGYNTATGWHTSTTTANSAIDYNYDALGRLTSVYLVKQDGVNLVTLGTDQTQSYTYDNDSNVTEAQVSQGTTVISTSAYTYDKLNRLQTLVQTNGTGTQLAKYTYSRYANGNISEVDESLLQPDSSTQTNTITYQYDADNRLTEEKLASSNSSLTQTTDYTMDLVGNRTQEVITKSGQTETIAFQYDARDRLTSLSDSISGTTTFGYDVNGNLTGQTNPDGSTVTYTFDLRGRMVEATAKTSAGGVLYVEQLTYNPDGIRTSSTLTQNNTTTTSRYLIDGMNPTTYAQVLEVLNNSGALVASYLHGLLGPISQLQGGQNNYYLMDGHSGVRQLLTTAGAVAASYLYSGYGNLLFSGGSVSNPLLYLGQWFDPVLGQYYLRARFYDSTTGRFTAMDPFVGNYNDPLQAMRYGYAGGNPMAGMDISGEFSLGGFSIGFGFGYGIGQIGSTAGTGGDTLIGIGTGISGALGKAGISAFQSIMGLGFGIALGAAVGFYGGFISGFADALARDPNVSNSDLIKAALIEGVFGAITGALAFAYLGGLGRYNGACFTAGTPLLTPDGAKPIEQFQPGDLVLARDENDPAGAVEAKVVEEVFVHHTQVLYLTVGGRTIGTTAEHPFYVPGQGWTEAGQLRPGNVLISHDGQILTVQAIEVGDWANVYNLRVQDHHTYFVGRDEWGFSIWAHNQCLIHYTNAAGFAGIMARGAIAANDRGIVYATDFIGSPSDVETVVFIGNPLFKGKGDFMIAFQTNPGVTFTPTGPGKPYEYTHIGSVRFGRHIKVWYAGPNLL